MDESGIEATQAMVFDDDDETDDEDHDRPLAYLNVPMQKGFPGKLFPLCQGDNIIGRGTECKICIPLKALSREHACIEIQGDAHFIYDKGSCNKTRRNKHFLAASVRYELKDKDTLTFGDVHCVYQLQEQEDDAGSETGSEGIFQTATDDEDPRQAAATHNNNVDISKPVDEADGFESDASSDILEPTQRIENTQSLMSRTGNSTFVPDITVQETPANARTKRFTENLVLPESGSEDEEAARKPPATLAIPESQDEDGDVKSRLMGAATQAFVCESDVTTDDEDEDSILEHKKSLLMAPTQAFVEDSDVSTCSEASPVKKARLMSAATQAVVSDNERSPAKRKILIEPTQAYTMVEGIEPTQAYDMIEESDDKAEDTSLRKNMMFEPTQAFTDKPAADEDDDGLSDTSEEFVLEGDTDTEDNPDTSAHIMAAPTLAMETQSVGDSDETDDEDGATVAITEQPTQAVRQQHTKPVVGDSDATVAVNDVTDETVAVNDETVSVTDATMVVSDATVAVTDMATQAFDDMSPVKQNFNNTSNRTNKSSPTSKVNCDDATQVFDDNNDSTQVFDSNIGDSGESNLKKLSGHAFDDATQVIETDDGNKSDGEFATQVFDNTSSKTLPGDSKSGNKAGSGEMATQAFSDEDSDIEEFNINAASTLAVVDDVPITRTELENSGLCNEATQAFDEDGATLVIEEDISAKREPDSTQVFDDATVAVQDDTPTKRKPLNDDATQVFDDATVAVQDDTPTKRKPLNVDATQVFDDATVAVQDDTPTKRKPLNDDATQVFDDATVAVQDDTPTKRKPLNDDATQVFDDATVAVQDDTPTKRKPLNDDATQVFDDATVAVQDDTPTKRKPLNDDATQVFDDATVPVKEESPSKRKPFADDATQVLDDATQVIDDATVAIQDEMPTPSKRRQLCDDATQVFDDLDANVGIQDDETAQDATVAISDVIGDESPTKQMRQMHDDDDATQVLEDDSTVGIEQLTSETVTMLESNNISKTAKGNVSKVATEKGLTHVPDSEAATQVFDEQEVEDVHKVGMKNKTNSSLSDANKTAKTTGGISDSIEVEQETRKGKRGKTKVKAVEVVQKTDQDQTSVKVVEPTITRKGRSKKADPDQVEITEAKVKTVGKVTKQKKKEETVMSNTVTVADASESDGNVRRSGRVRIKKVDKDFVSEDTEKSNRGKGKGKGSKTDIVESETESHNRSKGKTTESREDNAKIVEEAKKTASPEKADVEMGEATQVYGDDDATPELDEMETEDDVLPVVPVVMASSSKSPLKSAMASPRKASPSPKKVKFVSQNSESGSESSQPSRRSGRGKAKDVKHDNKVEPTSRRKTAVKHSVSDQPESAVETKEQSDNTTRSKSRRGKRGIVEVASEETVAGAIQTKSVKVAESKSDSKEAESVANPTRTSSRGKKVEDIEAIESIQTESETIKSTRTSKRGRSIAEQDEKMAVEEKAVSEKRASRNAKGASTLGNKIVDQINSKTKDLIGDQEKETSKVDRKSLTRTGLKCVNDSAHGAGDVNPTTNQSAINATINESKKSNRKTVVKQTESESKADNDGNKGKSKADSGDRMGEISSRTTRGTRTSKTNKDDQGVGNSDKQGENVSETVVGARTSRNRNTKHSVNTVTETNQHGHIGKSKETNSNTRSKSKPVTETTTKAKGKTRDGAKEKEPILEEAGKPTVEAAVENEVPATTRTKRRGADASKENTNSVKDDNKASTKQTTGMKRKESDSSADSQQSVEEPRGKRQKTAENPGAAPATPKHANKRVSLLGTPKNSSQATDDGVMHSPTLRKTTTDGNKAKVMFTGVVDQVGEKTVKELGGELASSVTDCTHLVTDKVRRTVKFLCCLARGIPIVTPQWLVSSRNSSLFSEPTPFLIQDHASEKKHKFSLQLSLAKASEKQLFSGYRIHVTKSVNPEPKTMKDIVTCAGAQYLASIPKTNVEGTVIVSCVDDKPQCEAAYKAGIHVVDAEFVLTGVLRQDVDINSHLLFTDGSSNKRGATTSDATSKKRKR